MLHVPLPLVPGQVRVPAAVLAAREHNYPSADLEPEFFDLYRRVQGQLGAIVGTAHPPATMLEAMVMLWGALKSCVALGDRVLAISTGRFGEGFADRPRRFRRRGLVVGGNYGRLAGRNFRIGHMGTQADEALVAAAMAVVAESLRAAA